MTTPGAIRAHRTVVVVEDAPTTPEEGVDPAGAHTGRFVGKIADR
jgi:hypothetical protein